MPGNGIEPLCMDFQSTALPLSYPSISVVTRYIKIYLNKQKEIE